MEKHVAIQTLEHERFLVPGCVAVRREPGFASERVGEREVELEDVADDRHVLPVVHAGHGSSVVERVEVERAVAEHRAIEARNS